MLDASSSDRTRVGPMFIRGFVPGLCGGKYAGVGYSSDADTLLPRAHGGWTPSSEIESRNSERLKIVSEVGLKEIKSPSDCEPGLITPKRLFHGGQKQTVCVVEIWATLNSVC